MLAHAAYCKSGGTASVSVALWSPDGSPPADMGEWEAATEAAPPAAAIEAAVREALLGPSGVLLLRQVPKVHTAWELTALLEGSSDPAAAEFLAARSEKDKTKQKQLKGEMTAGKWDPLLSSLGVQVDSSPPFNYPNFPMGESDDAMVDVASSDALTGRRGYLCLAEFLHFDIESPPSRSPATGSEHGPGAAAVPMVAPEAGGLRAGGV